MKKLLLAMLMVSGVININSIPPKMDRKMYLEGQNNLLQKGLANQQIKKYLFQINKSIMNALENNVPKAYIRAVTEVAMEKYNYSSEGYSGQSEKIRTSRCNEIKCNNWGEYKFYEYDTGRCYCRANEDK